MKKARTIPATEEALHGEVPPGWDEEILLEIEHA